MIVKVRRVLPLRRTEGLCLRWGIWEDWEVAVSYFLTGAGTLSLSSYKFSNSGFIHFSLRALYFMTLKSFRNILPELKSRLKEKTGKRNLRILINYRIQTKDKNNER